MWVDYATNRRLLRIIRHFNRGYLSMYHHRVITQVALLLCTLLSHASTHTLIPGSSDIVNVTSLIAMATAANSDALFTSTIKIGTIAPEDITSTLDFEATPFDKMEDTGISGTSKVFQTGEEEKEEKEWNAKEEWIGEEKQERGRNEDASSSTSFNQNESMASNYQQPQLRPKVPPTLSPLLKSMSLVIIDAPASSSTQLDKLNNLNNDINNPSQPLITYNPSLNHQHPNSVTNLFSPHSPTSINQDSYSIYDDSSLPMLNETAKVIKAPDSITNITGEMGGTVFLPCSAHHSMEKQVSWVRRRDWHILTSGTVAYTKEERFSVHHPEGSTDWTLVIKYLENEDSGTYECQVSTGSGLLSRLVELDVMVPKAVIPGNGEYHIDSGSTITLDCYIHQNLVAPQFIFWYHNSRMINYDRERGGINVQIDSGPQVRSRLTVKRVIPADSGNYTCAAANTQPASTTVYISYGSKMAAIHPRHYVGGATTLHPCVELVVFALTITNMINLRINNIVNKERL